MSPSCKNVIRSKTGRTSGAYALLGHAASGFKTLFMKLLPLIKIFAFILAVAVSAFADSGLDRDMPWREAGLTERQAAAHLLDRFAYGPRPGQIDELIEIGLGNWLEGQLAGDLPGSVLDAKLARLDALALPQRAIIQRYSYGRGRLVQQAIAARVISMEDYSGERGPRNLRAAVAALDRFAAERGVQPEQQLFAQLRAQKLLRAVYSQSQLVEVLTDFWFNHFNVSINSNGKVHVLSYERDAIRPNVLTSFRQLLGASARHPAMLLYLDNAESVAGDVTTAFDLEIQDLDRLSPGDNPTLRQKLAKRLGWFGRDRSGPLPGLNENYARELLELHTLGVDGGYRQRDVIHVARAFTGWGTFPPGGARGRLEDLLVRMDTAETARDMGFVVEEEFVFRADEHDAEAKTVLGVSLPEGRGIEDGEEVLDLLAQHRSTRQHLARKLAIRFVSEHPSRALIQDLEETWELTEGDLPELIRTLVRAPEFWDDQAREAKVKTPFELVASALRALDVEVYETEELIRWISRMGQPLYAFSAPTGFPDRGDYWANVGPLLGRINFGMALTSRKIKGVKPDLSGFLDQRRLESLAQAAEAVIPLLMPERDTTATLASISKNAIDVEKSPPPERAQRTESSGRRRGKPKPDYTVKYAALAAGMLIGSPQFQVK